MLEAVDLRSMVTIVVWLWKHRTDARLLILEREAVATTFDLRLRTMLRSHMQRGRLIVLNSGHAILGHKRTANGRKLGAFVGSTIDMLVTLGITREATKLVAKLSVL